MYFFTLFPETLTLFVCLTCSCNNALSLHPFSVAFVSPHTHSSFPLPWTFTQSPFLTLRWSHLYTNTLLACKRNPQLTRFLALWRTYKQKYFERGRRREREKERERERERRRERGSFSLLHHAQTPRSDSRIEETRNLLFHIFGWGKCYQKSSSTESLYNDDEFAKFSSINVPSCCRLLFSQYAFE